MPSTNRTLTKSALTALVCILIGTTLLYLKGLTPSFSSDDFIHLDKNIAFNNLGQAGDVFLHLDGREYRPLVRLSLWLNYRMGATALPFHITNLVLYLAGITCLYFLFFELSGSRSGALVGCLLFGLHPIHTTNVDFIMGRTGLLCGLFYFLALLMFMLNFQKPSAGRYALSLGCFMLALLSKEEAVSMPVLLFFIILLQPHERSRKPLIHCAVQLSPFLAVLSAYLAIRLYSLSGHFETVAVYTNYSGLHILSNYVKWVMGLAYPFDLYQARLALEARQFRAIAVPVGVVCLMAVGLIYILWPSKKKLHKNKLMLLSLLWFLVTLLPMMGGNAHRWYLYIPSAGLCLFVIAVGLQNSQGFRKPIIGLLLIATLVCYAREVYKQSEIWSRQSQICASFLEQAGALGLHKLGSMYFINMPFGYKSAFLFTFGSFEKALAIRYGKQPQIKILTYINLDDNTRVETIQRDLRLTFHMHPTATAYFIFPDLQHVFPPGGATLTVDTCRIAVTHLSQAGAAATYYIELPNKAAVPVFYFDGKEIRRLPSE